MLTKRWYLYAGAASLIVLIGAIGAAIGVYWLSRYQPNLNQVNSPAYTNTVLWPEAQKQTVIEQDKKINEVNQTLRSYLWGLYEVNAKGEIVDWHKVLGQGVTLTGDGWLLVKSNNPTLEIKKIAAVNQDYRSYRISQTFFDEQLGLWLVKLDNSTSLSVASLGSVKSLSLGQMLITVGWRSGSRLLSIENKLYPQGVLSSDRFNFQLVTDRAAGKDKFLISNLNGQVLAIVDKEGELIPLATILPRVDSFLKNGKSGQVWLGVNYITQTPTLNKNKAVFGAKLSKNAGQPAVLKDSPAEKAGLKENDVILTIDGVDLTEFNDLSDIINNYKTADKIYIRYQRDGKEIVSTVYLGWK